MNDFDPFDDYDFDRDEIDGEDDRESDKWECQFPGECLMPGDHMASECHTVEMIRAARHGF